VAEGSGAGMGDGGIDEIKCSFTVEVVDPAPSSCGIAHLSVTPPLFPGLPPPPLAGVGWRRDSRRSGRWLLAGEGLFYSTTPSHS
jgi:hypothetical protein